jgi:hypothetical protein
MKDIFNLNEEEKNRIRGLHNINEQVVGYGEQGLDEDAGRDTPGGNPEYFYGDGSLDKLRKFAISTRPKNDEGLGFYKIHIDSSL